MNRAVLSVLFKCSEEGKVKAYLATALLLIDTVSGSSVCRGEESC